MLADTECPAASGTSPGGSPPAVRVREATESDRGAWDRYVEAHGNASPYHRFAWLTALEKGYGTATRRVVAEDSRGAIRGVLPAALVKRPFGRGRLCSLPYCDLGGALADSGAIEAELLRRLQRDALPCELRETSTWAPLTPEAPQPAPAGAKARLVLGLPGSSEALFDSFRSKHRSQIRKAEKNGLRADTGNGPGRVESFYPVYARNMRDLGSPPHSKRWFSAIAEAYAEHCSIGLVYLGTEVIGAGLVLRNGSRAAIPWASTIRDYNRLAPNMLLYWTLLAEAADAGLAHFDFGRSTVGEGTYRFKTQWGAEPVPLLWRTLEPGSTASAAAPRAHGAGALRGAAEATWRKLPLGMTVFLGARVRPWISL